MTITVRELNEYLVPKLCSLLLECKRCNKIREEMQEWLTEKVTAKKGDKDDH